MNSCIYEGQVKHRRFYPKQHDFCYDLFMLYLDLDELPELFNPYWLWSANRFNLAWFRRADHMGEASQSLKDTVRQRIYQKTGHNPSGPIRLLTHLRYLGYGFNPVSFYYCYDAPDKHLETIVCEVNNTPWGEQHLYILDEIDNLGDEKIKRYQRGKEFHVSPFMPMDIKYDWRIGRPDEKLIVHMENSQHEHKLFDATLTMQRTPICSATLARVLLQYPWMTAKVVFSIYWQALKLFLKKIPIYTHPDYSDAPKQVKKI